MDRADVAGLLDHRSGLLFRNALVAASDRRCNRFRLAYQLYGVLLASPDAPVHPFAWNIHGPAISDLFSVGNSRLAGLAK